MLNSTILHEEQSGSRGCRANVWQRGRGYSTRCYNPVAVYISTCRKSYAVTAPTFRRSSYKIARDAEGARKDKATLVALAVEGGEIG